MGFVWLPRDNCLQRATSWVGRGKGTEAERSIGGRVYEAG